MEDLEGRFWGNQIGLVLPGSILIPADGSMAVSSERSMRTGTEVLVEELLLKNFALLLCHVVPEEDVTQCAAVYVERMIGRYE